MGGLMRENEKKLSRNTNDEPLMVRRLLPRHAVKIAIVSLGVTLCLCVYIIFRASNNLHRAAASGDVRRVAEIIKGDPGRVNKKYVSLLDSKRNGQTPLAMAVEAGQHGTARALLDANADPDLATGPYRRTPLVMAVFSCDTAVVQLLLEGGANPAATHDGLSPLHVILIRECSESLELAEWLLMSGADPNARDSDGRTPLFYAVLFGRRDLIQVLVGAGGDPDAEDLNGESPRGRAKDNPLLEEVFGES